MRLRSWGRDLWARAKGRLDESVAAVILVSIVTSVSLMLVLFLQKLYFFVRPILPAGKPPNDWPRLLSIGFIYLGGIFVTLLLMYGFSHLSKLFSGAKGTATRAFFIHFGYAVIPLAVMKFLSDILDHIFRTWGAIVDVTRALIKDFPLNRIEPDKMPIKQLMSVEQTYILQMVLVGIGLGLSLYIAHKLAGRMFPDRTTAFRAFLPVGAFILILGMVAVWALAVSL